MVCKTIKSSSFQLNPEEWGRPLLLPSPQIVPRGTPRVSTDHCCKWFLSDQNPLIFHPESNKVSHLPRLTSWLAATWSSHSGSSHCLDKPVRGLSFSCPVMSDSLWPHGLQHARLPCSPLSPGLCSNSRPLCRWCHPNISSSVFPFSSCLHSFPASESFPMSQLFASSAQGIGVSASNISPSNEYSGLISFRMNWLDLLAVQRSFTLKSFLQHHHSKASILQSSAFFIAQLSHPYMITGKTIALTRWTFAGKVVSLLFNILSRFVTAFLPKNKHLLILWGLWLTYK